MKSEDFNKLPNFTELEVGRTGANFGDVEFDTMLCLQMVRSELGLVIRLIKNGLTTGKHQSKTHHDGKAVDFHFDVYVSPIKVIVAMIQSGFKGIGVYKNAKGFYSYHGDTRSEFGCWYREYSEDETYIEESLFNSRLFL